MSDKIEEILRSLLFSKKSNSKDAKKLIQKTNELIRKESLFLSLKKEVQYHENLNKEYQKYLKEIKKIKEKCHINKKEVENMCNSLRSNFKDYSLIVDQFDNKISVCNFEKDNIIKTNEDIIHQKNSEKAKLMTHLKEIEYKTSFQRNQIDEANIKIEKLKNQKKNEFDELSQKEKMDLRKYEALKKNFLNLKGKQAKYISQLKEQERISILMLQDVGLSEQILHQEDKEIELNEKQMRQQNLLGEIKMLSDKISKLGQQSNNIESYQTKDTLRGM